MKPIYPTTYIASVYQTSQSLTVNQSFHADFVRQLRDDGYSIKEVKGVYKGTKEDSVVILGWNDKTAQDHCRKYNQDCILKLDGSRHPSFVTVNEVNEVLGRFEAVNDNYNGDYTEDLTTGIKYAIVK